MLFQSSHRDNLYTFLSAHFISDLYLLPSHRWKCWKEPCPIQISVKHHIKENSVITHLSIRQLVIYLWCDSILSLKCHMVLSQILYVISAIYQIHNLIKADNEIRFAWQDLYFSKSCWLPIIIFSPFNSLWFKFSISLSISSIVQDLFQGLSRQLPVLLYGTGPDLLIWMSI